jgi:hypothetical protein
MLCVRDKEIVLDVKFIFSRYDLLESKDAMSAPCLGFTWQVANALLVPHLGTSEDGGRGAERERVNSLSATRRGKQPGRNACVALAGAAGRPALDPCAARLARRDACPSSSGGRHHADPGPPARCPVPTATGRSARTKKRAREITVDSRGARGGVVVGW